MKHWKEKYYYFAVKENKFMFLFDAMTLTSNDMLAAWSRRSKRCFIGGRDQHILRPEISKK